MSNSGRSTARSATGAPVKDRSGQGLPSKAERRALGKAAARKRAEQRRRREILAQVARIGGPIVVVGLIVLAVWLFGGGGGSPSTQPTAGPTTAAAAAADWVEPTLDPALSTKPVVTAGDGTLTDLKVTTLIAGTGPAIQVGDEIRVNYVGVYYATGEEFEGGSSWSDGVGSPYEAQVGVGGFIQGWDQGLIGVTAGSRVQLDIPVTMAYNHAAGKPDGDLRFVVDVLAVRPGVA